VEGHGEAAAIPVLLRRLRPAWEVARPVRVKRQKVVQAGELERYAKIADASRGGVGCLLLVLDVDAECAVALGPQLLARLHASLPHRACGCALAVRHYESWLVAGLSGSADRADEERPGESWILETRGRYVKTIHQPRLTAEFDLSRASACSRSFRHLLGEIERLASAAP
jgi:hypothetical protein